MASKRDAMTENWQRFASIVLLGLLGAGIIGFMVVSIMHDGQMSAADAGWITAAFLSLREVMSKIENVSLGIRTPAPPVAPAGEAR
jgi:SNF family Na+-dependent transporter